MHIEGGFIQPEGDASQLPDDVRDATVGLNYAELAPFFDETIRNLERDIPIYSERVVKLDQEWKDYRKGQIMGDERKELEAKRYVVKICSRLTLLQ